MKQLKSCLFAAALALAALPVPAATFVMPTDAELLDRSEAVVIGTVEGSFVQARNGLIETLYEVRVERSLKGEPRGGELLRVASFGGASAGTALVVPGAAHFGSGERVLLFLDRTAQQWRTVDMTLGKFRFATSTAGERLLVRDTEDVVGWDRHGSAHRERVRREGEFIRFLQERIGGRDAASDYFVDSGAVTLAPSHDERFLTETDATYSAGSYTIHVEDEPGVYLPSRNPNPAAITFYKRSDQNIAGAADGGVATIQNALLSWTNDCGSAINLIDGGPTAVVAGATSPAFSNFFDGINVIEFNDPQGKITGTFSGSGTVAVTFVWFWGGHTYASTDWWSIADTDIVFQDGFSASNPGFATAMTHEIGHAIGWRHSNADPLTPNGQTVNCNAAEEDCTETNSAIMFWQSSGAFGFTLQPWDKNAVRAVYPGGSCTRARYDYDGDARSDVFWRNGSTGQNAIWFGLGTSFNGVLIDTAPLPWEPRVSGDFDGDGQGDVFWFNPNTGETAIWLMDGQNVANAVRSIAVPTTWEPVPLSADFNGDGRSDLFWRNSSTGQNSIWYMNGVSAPDTYLTENAPAPWQPKVIGDFDGAGTGDVLWWNPTTGETSIWMMSGITVTSAVRAVTVADTLWQPLGGGDFNGDGRVDVLWRNTSTGLTSLWLMNGINEPHTVLSDSAPTSWNVYGVGDYDGDAKTDIFWSNPATGETSVWLMDGQLVKSAFRSFTIYDTNWTPATLR